MSCQTWLAFIVLILTNLSAFVTAQDYNCSNDHGNYTSNSRYSNNLKTLLSSLSSNIDSNGFYHASEGENPDQANAIVLCRGDIQLDTCHSCVQNATVKILNVCPNQKQAMLCLEFCTLRFSNESIYGKRADVPVVTEQSLINVSNPVQFKQDLRELIDDIRGQATSGGPLMKVAAGNHTAPDFQTIYGLLQCTPDISSEDCNGCLVGAAKRIPWCCDNKIGVRILTPSCNLRYEISTFYNSTRIQEAQATSVVPVPSLAPPISSPKKDERNGGGNTARTVINIAVPIVVFLILAAGNQIRPTRTCKSVYRMR